MSTLIFDLAQFLHAALLPNAHPQACHWVLLFPATFRNFGISSCNYVRSNMCAYTYACVHALPSSIIVVYLHAIPFADTCIHRHACVYIYITAYINIHIYIYTSRYIHIHIYIHVYIFMHKHMCVRGPGLGEPPANSPNVD